MRPNSSAPRPALIGSVRCANAGTGTASLPGPRAPSTEIRTCSEPRSISHRPAVKNCGSVGDRSARSATGGSSEPGPVSRSGTTEIAVTSLSRLRISIAATPGITSGLRTVT